MSRRRLRNKDGSVYVEWQREAEKEVNLDLTIANYMIPLYQDNQPYYDEQFKQWRFKYIHYVLYGGRGAGKSFQIIDYMIAQSFNREIYYNCTFLCTREIEKSIEKSIHPLIVNAIKRHQLESFFVIKRDEIVNVFSNVTFKFHGLAQNIDSIKSSPDIKMTFLEEASKISYRSLNILLPTITRVSYARILVAFNPEFATDAVYKTYIEGHKQSSYVCKVSYKDNPFTMGAGIYEEMEDMRKNDPVAFSHVYDGELRKASEELVFKFERHYTISDASDEIENRGHSMHTLFGLDFGFKDPTAVVRCLYDSSANIIYVTHELYKRELESDKIMQEIYKEMPFDNSRQQIIADSSRPETISLIRRAGYNIIGALKGVGSVEDGIAFLKTKKIIVHSRCCNLLDELTKYSFKKDKRSDVVTDILDDKDNHAIDALRYAFNKYIKSESIDYSKWKV